MQPITVFHRSVKHLVARRENLRTEIEQNEAAPLPAHEANMVLWSQIDEIDRQIGVAYYWHQAIEAEMDERR